MRALGIIQARLGSTRFPRKVLADLAGRPVIEHVFVRVHEAVPAVVACPATDEELLDVCLAHKIPTFPFAGDLNDVLARFRAVAAAYQPRIVVRITADCPFVQPAHIRACVELAEAEGFAALGPTTAFPDGLDVEAFRVEYLEQFSNHEHVTLNGPLPTVQVWHEPDLTDVRLTLDTSDDLATLRKIAERINCTPPHHPTLEELLQCEHLTGPKPSASAACPPPCQSDTPSAPGGAGLQTTQVKNGSTSWQLWDPSYSVTVIPPSKTP